MSRKNVSVHLKMDSITKILARRGLQDNGPAQMKCAETLARMCKPYVPRRQGELETTAQILQDGVLYIQPYSQVQYYTNAGYGEGGTAHGGLRGKYWDKRMMADRGDDYINTVAKFIGGKAK